MQTGQGTNQRRSEPERSSWPNRQASGYVGGWNHDQVEKTGYISVLGSGAQVLTVGTSLSICWSTKQEWHVPGLWDRGPCLGSVGLNGVRKYLTASTIQELAFISPTCVKLGNIGSSKIYTPLLQCWKGLGYNQIPHGKAGSGQYNDTVPSHCIPYRPAWVLADLVMSCLSSNPPRGCKGWAFDGRCH